MPEDLSFYRLTFIKRKHIISRSLIDKLMPSISTIDGLGDKAADAVVEAAKDGKFLSRDDFRTANKSQQDRY